jgi:hypothetical protein
VVGNLIPAIVLLCEKAEDIDKETNRINSFFIFSEFSR